MCNVKGITEKPVDKKAPNICAFCGKTGRPTEYDLTPYDCVCGAFASKEYDNSVCRFVLKYWVFASPVPQK